MTVDEPRTPPRVRRVRPEDWARLRDLRLEALRDPVAHLAFLERLDDARARPDDYWRERTAAAASGDAVVQVVALDPHDLPVGTVTARVTAPGEPDYLDRTADHVRAALVGVYLRPEHRGEGVLEALLGAVEAWLRDRGVPRVALHVHQDNARAARAYLRCGYADEGARVVLDGALHHELVRDLG